MRVALPLSRSALPPSCSSFFHRLSPTRDSGESRAPCSSRSRPFFSFLSSASLFTAPVIDTRLRRISNLRPVRETLVRLCLSEQPRLRRIPALDLPNLRDLLLQRNSIARIRGLEGCPRLQRLWLFSNRLRRMEGLEALGELRELWLQDNRITRLSGVEHLVQLQVLNVAANPLRDLRDLQKLSHLPALRSVSFDDPHFGACPLVDEPDYRETLLVSLPLLAALDGSPIAPEDRASAEEDMLARARRLAGERDALLRLQDRALSSLDGRRRRNREAARAVRDRLAAQFSRLERLVRTGLSRVEDEATRLLSVQASSRSRLRTRLRAIEDMHAHWIERRVQAEEREREEEELSLRWLEERAAVDEEYASWVEEALLRPELRRVAHALNEFAPETRALDALLLAGAGISSGSTTTVAVAPALSLSMTSATAAGSGSSPPWLVSMAEASTAPTSAWELARVHKVFVEALERAPAEDGDRMLEGESPVAIEEPLPLAPSISASASASSSTSSFLTPCPTRWYLVGPRSSLMRTLTVRTARKNSADALGANFHGGGGGGGEVGTGGGSAGGWIVAVDTLQGAMQCALKWQQRSESLDVRDDERTGGRATTTPRDRGGSRSSAEIVGSDSLSAGSPPALASRLCDAVMVVAARAVFSVPPPSVFARVPTPPAPAPLPLSRIVHGWDEVVDEVLSPFPATATRALDSPLRQFRCVLRRDPVHADREFALILPGSIDRLSVDRSLSLAPSSSSSSTSSLATPRLTLVPDHLALVLAGRVASSSSSSAPPFSRWNLKWLTARADVAISELTRLGLPGAVFTSGLLPGSLTSSTAGGPGSGASSAAAGSGAVSGSLEELFRDDMASPEQVLIGCVRAMEECHRDHARSVLHEAEPDLVEALSAADAEVRDDWLSGDRRRVSWVWLLGGGKSVGGIEGRRRRC